CASPSTRVNGINTGLSVPSLVREVLTASLPYRAAIALFERSVRRLRTYLDRETLPSVLVLKGYFRPMLSPFFLNQSNTCLCRALIGIRLSWIFGAWLPSVKDRCVFRSLNIKTSIS